jgi:hypothetical protein
MTSVNLSIKKIFLFVVLSFVPFALFYILVIVLIKEGFFDFLYSWPLVLSYLFFLLPTALMFGVSMIISVMLVFTLIFRGYCKLRFLRLVCTIEASKTESVGLGEMLHVKDVVNTLLFSVGLSMFPFIAFVLRGVVENVYPPDVFPLSIALFPWAILWTLLVWLMSEIMKYRYAEGLSFREVLQKLPLYTAEKKFGSAVFEGAVVTLAVYWGLNAAVAFFENSLASFYHFIAVVAVSVATPVVLAVVVGWVLDVFTRRLFGETLGKFLFSSFVVGAVFYPFLGVLTSFLFSWALFGRAKDAAVAAAVAAPSLLAVLLPGPILTWVSSLSPP